MSANVPSYSKCSTSVFGEIWRYLGEVAPRLVIAADLHLLSHPSVLYFPESISMNLKLLALSLLLVAALRSVEGDAGTQSTARRDFNSSFDYFLLVQQVLGKKP